MSKLIAPGAARADDRMTRRSAFHAITAGTVFASISETLALLPDPVIATICRHQAARTIPGHLCRAIDDVAASRCGRTVTRSDREAYDTASLIEGQVLAELVATSPASVTGMRAAIAYFLDFEDEILVDCARPFLATLLSSPALSSPSG
jgi:hypothetical protein